MTSAAGADDVDPTMVKTETVARIPRDKLRRMTELLDGLQEKYGSAPY
jgi:hypothetical protein